MFHWLNREKIYLEIVLINLLILIIYPFNLAIQDQYVFNLSTFIGFLTIFIFLSLISSFLFFILSKIFFKLSYKLETYFKLFLSFTLLWIFLTGTFFPVTGEHDPFLNLSISLNKKYEIILKFLLIIIFFTLILKKKIKKYIYRFISIYVVINLIFIISKINFSDSEKYKFNINEFGKKNLIVLSFDGITGYKIYNEVISNNHLREGLKDFIFYKNVTTAWPYTSGSINVEINGSFLDKNFDDYNNILNDKNLDIATYSYYGGRVANKKNTLPVGKFKDYDKAYNINSFFQLYFLGSTGRWATSLAISIIDPIFYSPIYKNFINLISLDEKNKLNPFNTIHSVSFTDLFEFDLIFNETKYNVDLENVVRMYQFSFSHWPIKVNQNCQEVKILNEISYEHEQIVIKCIAKKIIKFLDILKAQNIYENSMIVIKSDHGKPNYVQKNYSSNLLEGLGISDKKLEKYYNEFPYNLKINNSFYWGFGRYKTFVMIKDKSFKNDKIKISDKHVFIHDLSTTYCNFFYKKKRCEKYSRNNLAMNDSLFKKYQYDIYLPTNEKSFSALKDFKKYEISNNTSLLDFLKNNNIKIKQ